MPGNPKGCQIGNSEQQVLLRPCYIRSSVCTTLCPLHGILVLCPSVSLLCTLQHAPWHSCLVPPLSYSCSMTIHTPPCSSMVFLFFVLLHGIPTMHQSALSNSPCPLHTSLHTPLCPSMPLSAPYNLFYPPPCLSVPLFAPYNIVYPFCVH